MSLAEHAAELRAAGVPESVPMFRAMFRALAGQLGMTERQAADGELILSELATNALAHSRSGRPGGTIIVIAEMLRPGLLRITVIDAGPRLRLLPARSRQEPGLAEHGRGLDIVRILSQDSGRRHHAGWAEVAA